MHLCKHKTMHVQHFPINFKLPVPPGENAVPDPAPSFRVNIDTRHDSFDDRTHLNLLYRFGSRPRRSQLVRGFHFVIGTNCNRIGWPNGAACSCTTLPLASNICTRTGGRDFATASVNAVMFGGASRPGRP